MGAMPFHRASIHIPHNNAASFPFDYYEVQHFMAREKLRGTGGYLPHQSLIGSQKQLLACLSPGVKRSRYLNAAKRAVAQISTILAGEWHTLSYGLVKERHAT